MAKVIFRIMFLIGIGPFAMGQVNHVTFTRINGADGLPLGQVNDIVQDEYGFLWFSGETNGSLIKYDGQTMTEYRNDPENPNSLGGTYPECLLADKDGFIWIGLYGMGLDRFDPRTETFTHFNYDPNDGKSLSNDTVSSIIQGQNGTIYVGTYGGLNILKDPEAGVFERFSHDHNDETSISSNYIRELYEDRNGALWIGTGWQDPAIDLGGLNRFDNETNSFDRFVYDPQESNGLTGRRVFSMLEDTRGSFWVGTGNGLHSFNKETGTFTRIQFDDFEETPWINFIKEDQQGYLWVGEIFKGVFRYDPKTNKEKYFGNSVDLSETIIESGAWCLHISENGLIWLSTQPGVYMIDPYHTLIPFTNAPLGQYLIVNDYIYRGEGNQILRYRSGSDVYQTIGPLSGTVTTPPILDGDSILWIGTDGGLDNFDIRNGLLQNDVLNNQLAIMSLHQITDKSLAFGTIESDLIIWRRNEEHEEITNFSSLDFSGEPYIQIDAPVHKMVNGDPSTLWVLTSRGAGFIGKVDLETKEVKHYNLGNYPMDIFMDGEGDLWVTSSSGLFIYDKENDNFKNIIPESTQTLVADTRQNLWISSFNGIYRLEKGTMRITKFEGIDYPEFPNYSAQGVLSYMDHTGKIHLGNQQGYFSFFPDSISAPFDKSQLFPVKFWVNNKEIKPNPAGPLKEYLPEIKSVELPYDNNSFELALTEIDYRDKKGNTILYQLDGYDNDWRRTFSNDKISYQRIPAGVYQLKYYASNSAAGSRVEKVLSITILPPWWQTWWAYALYFLVLVFAVLVVDRYQRRRLIRKERERTKDRELSQAKKIEEAYNQLQSTQSQLIHSEKMASLGELTAGIAHEIQNPLNFVNNFSEVNSELVEELIGELSKGNIKEAEQIGKEIIENEDKITHHGKRAEQIVKSMLQHSRGSEGEKKLTDMNALCDEYMRLAYHGFRAKDSSFNADFQLDLDPNLQKIELIPQDIGRVLLNIINNAFQALSSEALAKKDANYKPTVTLSTLHTPPSRGERGGVSITISDNGPGIPNEIKDKIFQPFFTTKPTGQGTGLGLSMSYDIVTKGHGGTIEVESVEEQGTTFIISLPYS